VRKGLEEAARETQSFVYQNGAKMDEELLGKMKDSGIKVNEADKKAFQAASKPVYDEFSKEVPGGQEMIEKAIALGRAK
jgi:TRAP-type C4-dicarboxylate transport system substrate-binding protein